MECIFCKILSGDTPANIIYKDEKVIAFDDIFPKSPVHKLIIPKKHIATLNDVTEYDSDLISHMLFVAKTLAAKYEIAESGYRIVINCNPDGGQVVYHLHLHLMGGKTLNCKAH
ncbi:MAG: histidine triad nucleotide-binding protein [Gammaproteobacteria bacterium]|nr:histidine triad nucleotide-binding protein [Gammaproteobacteria bacterium]